MGKMDSTCRQVCYIKFLVYLALVYVLNELFSLTIEKVQLDFSDCFFRVVQQPYEYDAKFKGTG